LRAVARRQHGLFTREQARVAGFSIGGIQRRLGRGVWEEVAPLVYRTTAAPPLPWTGRLVALMLSVDGVAYGPSAAVLYGMIDGAPEPEVVVARALRNRKRGGVHSSIALPSTDIAVVQGIRATMPARTLIDLGRHCTGAALVDAVDRAVVKRLVTPHSLWRRARELRAPARPGARRVLDVLASQHPDAVRMRSLWEARVVRMIRERGLPAPEVDYEVVVGGQRRFLDLAWPRPTVCFELDGFGPHVQRRVFDDDRIRQNDLVEAGWRVFRATPRILEREPERVLGPLARALRASSRR
jgi:very-short-patch-repair endonuclease